MRRMTAFLLIVLAGCFPTSGVPARETLLAVSRSGHEVVAFDTETGAVTARYPTGRGPHEIALSPDRRIAFVPNYGRYPAPHAEPREGTPQWVDEPSGMLTRIDLAAGPTSTWQLEECARPHGVVMAADARTVWITCEDTSSIVELDASDGRMLRRWPTGQRGSHAILVSPGGQQLIVANTIDAGVTIIGAGDGARTFLPVGRATEGLALSPDGRRLFALSAGDDRLSVIDLERRETVAVRALGTRFPINLVLPPGREEIWIAGNQANEILILDSATLVERGRIPLGTQPLGLLAADDGRRVYAALPRRNEVLELDAATRGERRRFGGVEEADGLALTGYTAGISAPAESPAPIEGITTAADGVRVHIYEYGRPQAGRRTPVLLFHQGGGDARGEFGPIAARLVAEGYHVFAADLRIGGARFGGENRTATYWNGHPADYCAVSPDLDAALAFVWERIGRRVAVVGSSYSGALVVRLAARRPQNVAGFIAFSPAGGAAMAGCDAESVLADVRTPGLAVRTRASTAQVEWMAANDRRWREAGLAVDHFDADGHGASLLLPDRTSGEVDRIWQRFAAMLAQIGAAEDD